MITQLLDVRAGSLFRPSVAASLGLPGLGCSSLPESQAPCEDMPNIVFILADEMGYGDPGCNNRDSRIETREIDSLAEEGMRFLDAHAPESVCVLSRYGLLPGAIRSELTRACVVQSKHRDLQTGRQVGDPRSPGLVVGPANRGGTRDSEAMGQISCRIYHTVLDRSTW